MNKLNREDLLKNTQKKEHKFWKSQPVPALEDYSVKFGSILTNDEMKSRRSSPYKLHESLEWYDIDITDKNDVNKLSEFLNKYYVEDSNNEFRFLYTTDFLQWALCPPNHKKLDLCFSIRLKETGVIVGFMSGVMLTMNIGAGEQGVGDGDFLCVHPKLRKKGLAQVLIKEAVRRMVLCNRYQATYAGANKLPKPVCKTQYYHRIINLRKLVDVGFTDIEGSIDSVEKLFELPNETSLNLRRLEERDVETTYKLLNNYLKKFVCYVVFSKDEFKHWFLGNKFTSTFVSVDDDDNVTDMISYYRLDNQVLKKNKKHKFIYTAYLFYYTSTTHTLYKLGLDMLVMAKKENIDVVNATTIMENRIMIDSLNFTEGTGELYYYFLNWKCPDLKPSQIAKHCF
jgi:glycylpeptide N-tetradecanoyltransferase